MNTLIRSIIYVLFLIYFLLLNFSFAKEKKKEKISTFGQYEGYQNKNYKGFTYFSKYIKAKDGTLLAADIFLPKKLRKNEKVPTILYLNRYVRSLKAKFPFRLLKHPVLTVVSEEEINYFTSHGYACVIIDTRGSGASLGLRKMEFSPQEVKDGADVVDWIIDQKWSDGKVGSTGISYLGTTAELLLINQHPNVKACIPRSNIFDLYNHMLFPGGVRQGCFIDVWGFTTRSLDQNYFAPFGKKAKRLIATINPVQGDKKNMILKQALQAHKSNFNVYEGIKKINFRDEIHPNTNEYADQYSIHNYIEEIEKSKVPIFRIGGWYDGVLAKSCIEGYLNTSNTKRVMIGPWDHGPHNNASPYSNTKKVTFDLLAEMLRFFDFYLKEIPNGIDKEPLFNYYTIGEEKWKNESSWPPQKSKMTDYYFSTNRKLLSDKSQIQEGEIQYPIDYYATTVNSSRYNSVTELYRDGDTDYPDRSATSARLLNFTGPELDENVIFSGHPIVTLNWKGDANDAAIFVYIEEVWPDGKVIYVTEGTFRPMHRKIVSSEYKYPAPFHSYKTIDAIPYTAGESVELQFDCAPISYQFKKGNSIRISIAGADIAHFDLTPEIPQNFWIYSDKNTPSKISLPVVSP